MPGLSCGAARTSAIADKCTPGLDESAGDAKRAIGTGQHAPARRLDDHVVLDAHAAPARDVDARLDGHDHALFEDRFAAGVEARSLVRLEAQTVAHAVDEPVGHAAGPAHAASRLVHFAHG